MSNLWELQPTKDATTGKYSYQPVTLVITAVNPEVKNYKNGDYQNCSVLSKSGNVIPASIFYKTGDPKITEGQINTPIECRVKIEPDAGRYAVDGLKYTLMLGEKKSYAGSGGSSGGYSGGGKSYSRASSEDPKEKRAMICLSYANTRYAGKEVSSEEITKAAEYYYHWVDLFLSEAAKSSDCPI